MYAVWRVRATGGTQAIGAVAFAVARCRGSRRRRRSSLTRNKLWRVVRRVRPTRQPSRIGARCGMTRRERGEIDIVLTGSSRRRESRAAGFAAERTTPPCIADVETTGRRCLRSVPGREIRRQIPRAVGAQAGRSPLARRPAHTFAARAIARNSSAFKLAPPTSAPPTCGTASSEPAFAGRTDPP